MRSKTEVYSTNSQAQEKKDGVWGLNECTNDLIVAAEKGSTRITMIPKDASQMHESLKVKIDFHQKFLYDDKTGWHWHKSWNVPTISVGLEIKDRSSHATKQAPDHYYSQLFCVQVVKQNEEKPVLHDRGVKGIAKKNFNQGLVQFSSLKFITTSYYHDGNPFRILIAIFSRKHGAANYLTAHISPPIFIDSRKMARETELCKKKKKESVRGCFSIELLNAQYFKRINKSKNVIEIPIENNFDGLYNYFTAPNIRNKIRHPLFLTIKFNNCISFFYDKTLFPTESLETILSQLQVALEKEACRSKIVENDDLDSMMAVMQIICTEEQKKEMAPKIVSGIELVEGHSEVLKIVLTREEIPRHFSRVRDAEALRRAVKGVFGVLNGSVSSERPMSDSRTEREESNRESCSYRSKAASAECSAPAQSSEEEEGKQMRSRSRSKARPILLPPLESVIPEPCPALPRPVFDFASYSKRERKAKPSAVPVNDLLSIFSQLIPYPRQTALQLPIPAYHIDFVPPPPPATLMDLK